MEITKQVALFLNDNGFGIFDETGVSGDIFINTLPDQPDAAIGIYSTGGPIADPNNEYGTAAIQLIIRSKPNDPRLAEQKAQNIVDRLNGFNSGYFATGGHFIIDVIAQQAGPANIGADQKGRYEFSQNFIIEYAKGVVESA